MNIHLRNLTREDLKIIQEIQIESGKAIGKQLNLKGLERRLLKKKSLKDGHFNYFYLTVFSSF